MAADFLSLIGAIPTLMHNFSGSESAPYRKQQEQIAQRQNQLSQAMTDTNNPLYQQIYGQYKQQNQNNLAQVIAEAQGQNRMNAGMGRLPLFNQERGSENIFRNLMQGYQNQGTQADQQTRQALGQAMYGNQAAQGQYNTISPYGQAANAQQLSGYNLISNMLGGNPQGLYNRNQPQVYQPSQVGQNIRWNQPQQMQQMQQMYNPINGQPNQPNTVRGSYGY